MRRSVTALGIAALLLLTSSVAVGTPPQDVTPTSIAGATSFADGIKVKQDDPDQAHVVQLTYGPLGHTGWHSHPGPAVIFVRSGTLDVYTVRPQGGCEKETFGPGEGLVEDPRDTQITINPSITDTTDIVVVFFDVPPGGATRIDRPDPGCLTA